ncbi:hypothetical protein [Cyclobacterium plantarum]|uniref:hypothetical protein n=1 Tax=Cyclobacterium plantarum TaxID=2716263 RepID=UPI003F717BAE
MKKLNLEKLKLAAEDVLQRSLMEFIYGGSGCGASCQVQCDNWTNFRPMEVPFCSQGDLLCSGGYQCYHC